ncbi:hypothetical protein Q3G72_023081 [Acer saccharum]|nr:hypothetical protein Q3G72_023081 [Acer saccharum]
MQIDFGGKRKKRKKKKSSAGRRKKKEEEGVDGDDEVEPGSGLTLPLVGEATEADEFIKPRRSGRNEVRDLEDEFESDNEAVEENVEFESDDDVFELEEYVVEDEELDS